MKTIKLFRVLVDGLFYDDIDKPETYSNFPVEHNTDYFEWSEDLAKKLKEYTEAEVFWNKCDKDLDVDFAEKRLVFCEMDESVYNELKESEDVDDAINYQCNFDWIELQYERLTNPFYLEMMKYLETIDTQNPA